MRSWSPTYLSEPVQVAVRLSSASSLLLYHSSHWHITDKAHSGGKVSILLETFQAEFTVCPPKWACEGKLN